MESGATNPSCRVLGRFHRAMLLLHLAKCQAQCKDFICTGLWPHSRQLFPVVRLCSTMAWGECPIHGGVQADTGLQHIGDGMSAGLPVQLAIELGRPPLRLRPTPTGQGGCKLEIVSSCHMLDWDHLAISFNSLFICTCVMVSLKCSSHIR